MRAAVLTAVVLLAGCGTTSRPQEPHGSVSHPPRAAQLLYVWRNFEETGIPEEMTIYANGDVRYRNLLHTQKGIPVLTGHLAPDRLTRIRRALDAVNLSRLDASGVKPRRSGYRYWRSASCPPGASASKLAHESAPGGHAAAHLLSRVLSGTGSTVAEAEARLADDGVQAHRARAISVWNVFWRR